MCTELLRIHKSSCSYLGCEKRAEIRCYGGACPTDEVFCSNQCMQAAWRGGHKIVHQEQAAEMHRLSALSPRGNVATAVAALQQAAKRVTKESPAGGCGRIFCAFVPLPAVSLVSVSMLISVHMYPCLYDVSLPICKCLSASLSVSLPLHFMSSCMPLGIPSRSRDVLFFFPLLWLWVLHWVLRGDSPLGLLPRRPPSEGIRSAPSAHCDITRTGYAA